MKSILKSLALSVALLASASAMAGTKIDPPIANSGTVGMRILVTSTDNVFATYLGNSAMFSNDLYLGDRLIFNNQQTVAPTTIDLGSFAVGTELVFTMKVAQTGDVFSSGDGSRNSDQLAHARVQQDWQGGASLVSFEDLLGNPEGLNGYNDLSFSLTHTATSLKSATDVASPVPEPETYGMLLVGLGLIGAIRRRKNAA